MEKGERENVYKVYDIIASWFFKSRDTSLFEKSYLDDVISHLPADATFLDLGCGTGMPILKYFIDKKFNVTGVDASNQMLEIAKSNFPQIEFISQDMRMLNLNRKFNAIIAWHSFFHLPPSDQPAMFQRFEEHLKPDGILLFTSGVFFGEVWSVNGGEKLFHGSLDSGEYENLLKKHHFRVLKHKKNDPDCRDATVWMAKYIGGSALY
ncbi:MAG TPA: class I SAM-dependent methyltransferase [Puia sp.]|jgi:trans-aconitate methyltransferase|nr:class I SAM-dependent methyltransferase [Puia sp.]